MQEGKPFVEIFDSDPIQHIEPFRGTAGIELMAISRSGSLSVYSEELTLLRSFRSHGEVYGVKTTHMFVSADMFGVFVFYGSLFNLFVAPGF